MSMKTEWDFTVGWQTPVSNTGSEYYEIDIYFEGQEQVNKKYGEDAILLYQCGHFFEIYGREDNDEDERRLSAIAECCNVATTFKSQGIPKHRYDRVLMQGVNISSLDKYRGTLLENGWTIVIVKEKESNGQLTTDARKLREIKEIVSGATSDIMTGNTYTLASIYTEQNTDRSGKVQSYSVGFSSINSQTGQASIEEFTHTKSNVVDFINRVLLATNPNEILLCDDLKLFELSLYRTTAFPVDDNLKNTKWIFENLLTYIVNKPVRKLNLKQIAQMREEIGIPQDLCSSHGFTAFGSIMTRIMREKMNCIRSIHFNSTKGLCLLYGNAMEQLSIFSKKSYTSRMLKLPSQMRSTNTGYDSLYSLMNCCSSEFGKRYLHYNLANPQVDKEIIECRHEAVDKLKSVNLYKDIRSKIMGSLDGERIVRSLEIRRNITPTLIENLWRFLEMWNDVQEVWDCDISGDVWKQMLDNLNETFIKSALQDNKGSLWSTPISLESKYKIEQDTLNKKQEDRLDHIKKILNLREKQSSGIKYIINDENGYMINITETRAKALNKWKKSVSSGSDDLYQELIESSIKTCQKQKRLVHPKWKIEYERSLKLNSLIHEENEELMNNWCDNFWDKYGESLQEIVVWASETDMMCSFAKISAQYGYHKPSLLEEDDTTDIIVQGKNLRHPMIERLQEDVAGYVGNDVYIGKTNSLGNLLYGMNASGKSSYMKSIGLSLIMSQVGCWVPCEDMKHRVMTQIFTRISGNDDYMRGKSSFALEVDELAHILRHSNDSSIVLGDELCRGTEHVSGTAIVGSGINSLIKKNVPFVFATHLHDIPKLSVIKDMIDTGVLNVSHLRVREENGVLFYDRKLEPGSGSSMYGIEVAKALGLDMDTVDLATEIRDELLGFTQKTSRYNSSKQIKICEVCNKNPAVETHHIMEQHTATKDKIVQGSTRLNQRSNLVGICESCHDLHHKGEIQIEGWVETSNGPVLKVSPCK